MMKKTEFYADISDNFKEYWLDWCAADEHTSREKCEYAYNKDGSLDNLHEKYSGKKNVKMHKEDYSDTNPLASPDYFISDDNNFVIPEHLFEINSPKQDN